MTYFLYVENYTIHASRHLPVMIQHASQHIRVNLLRKTPLSQGCMIQAQCKFYCKWLLIFCGVSADVNDQAFCIILLTLCFVENNFFSMSEIFHDHPALPVSIWVQRNLYTFLTVPETSVHEDRNGISHCKQTFTSVYSHQQSV